MSWAKLFAVKFKMFCPTSFRLMVFNPAGVSDKDLCQQFLMQKTYTTCRHGKHIWTLTFSITAIWLQLLGWVFLLNFANIINTSGSGINTERHQKITIRKHFKSSPNESWRGDSFFHARWRFIFQPLIDVLLIKAHFMPRTGGALFLWAIGLKAWIAAELQSWAEPKIFLLYCIRSSNLGSCRKVQLKPKFGIVWKFC